MSFELIRLQPHQNRESEEEVMVLIKKGSKRVKDGEANITLYRVQVYILDTVKKKADGFQACKFPASPKFDVIADHVERSVEFSLGEMGQLMPVELRGGGLGSLIMSELIKWAKNGVGDYSVTPIKVFAPPDEAEGAIQRNKAFLRKVGFLVGDQGGGGKGSVYGMAKTVSVLKTHTNLQKLERVDLPSWVNEVIALRVPISNQLEAEVANASMYRMELLREKDDSKGKMSFWAGLFLGLAVGIVAAVLLTM